MFAARVMGKPSEQPEDDKSWLMEADHNAARSDCPTVHSVSFLRW